MNENLFFQVQEALKQARKKERDRLDQSEKRIFLLSGILRCSECLTPLVGHTAHGRTSKHRYYAHTVSSNDSNCKFKRFNANEIEQKVIQYIYSAIVDAGYFKRLELKLKDNAGVRQLDLKREKTSIEKLLQEVQIKVDNFLLIQTGISDEKTLLLVTKTFESLHREKQQLENRLSDLSDTTTANKSVQ